MQNEIPKKIYVLAIALLFVLMLVGVLQQNKLTTKRNETVSTAKIIENNISLIFTPINLKRLTNAHYEGWIVTTSHTTSTGKFNIDDNFQIVSLDNKPFTPNIPQDLEIKDVIEYFITIENIEDQNDRPSVTIILKGYFDKNQAILNFYPDITTVSGSALLLEEDSILSGIQFSQEDNTPSLNLPKLNEGWHYATWINYDDKYYSMGTINKIDTADDSMFYSDKIQLFPGEYFINSNDEQNFPLSLNSPEHNVEILVSIVPSISNGESKEPFFLIPLKAEIPKDIKEKQSIQLNQNFANFPKGIVTLQQK